MTVAPEHIQRKGRLAPGKLFLVDLEEGRIVEDEEVKRRVARRKPYAEWYERSVVHIADLPDREHLDVQGHYSSRARMRARSRRRQSIDSM